VTIRAGFESNRELFQGPLLTAVREVPNISAVLVLLHSPLKTRLNPTTSEEGEGVLEAEEVARALELLQEGQEGEKGDNADAMSLLRRRSSRAVGGTGGALEGQRSYAVAKTEAGGLSAMLSPSLLTHRGETGQREVRWRVQGCSVESGDGLRRALHWMWTHTQH
jgi:hypothetical protein